MAEASRTGIFVVVTGLVVLAGCQNGTPFSPTTRNDPTADASVSSGEAAGTIIEKDVEAPDVFAANEAGLWDGRPSLGGVWVAHPEVADPERVIIRNEANGKFVIGALFRRERENPGPRIQVSSDAATELGMLAGQPSVLDVIALRRETVEVPAEPSVAPIPVEPMAIADETTAVETAEIAAADIDTAEPQDTEALAAADGTAAPEPKRKKKKGFLAGLFGGKAAKASRQPAVPPASGAIETASLDPIAAASAAIDEAEAGPASAASAPGTQVKPAPAGAPKEPYIQIGIFSVEENAQNTATSLRSAGLVPTVREQAASGKSFWRVIVGPATSKDERRTILGKVRDLGFKDAYYVTN